MFRFKIESTMDAFLFFIIFIKIAFICLAITNRYLTKHKTNNNPKLNATVLYWKEHTEFIFIVCMSLLLIYHFFPNKKNNKPISKETGILFFLFGCISIITANWSIFFT